jgi:hypothetical protein
MPAADDELMLFGYRDGSAPIDDGVRERLPPRSGGNTVVFRHAEAAGGRIDTAQGCRLVEDEM